ncbi:MAG: hypothetical protein JSS49_02855 [Planctomycetes bacterium]|nr:hypothetical protein [Planctomycetota bacterium]
MTRAAGIAKAWIICLLLLTLGCGTAKQDTATAPASDVIERVTEKGPVKLIVRVTPGSPRLSDLVEMDVSVTAPSEVEITPPAFGAAVGDFLVRDYGERKEESAATEPADVKSRRFRYELEPVHAGRHLIRSIAIEFVDRRPKSETRGEPAVIESEPIEVQITSELGDQVPDLANLEPMVPPQPLTSASSWNWAWLLAVAAVVAGILIWRRSRQKQAVAEVYQRSPEEIAHAALATLLAENLPAKGQFKEFYLRLTGIVRQYIEGTTGLRAPEQTTEEFLREVRLRDVFPAERSLQFKEFLEAADMVKYAGQQPDTDQIELSILRAREFVGLQTSSVPEAVLTEGRA